MTLLQRKAANDHWRVNSLAADATLEEARERFAALMAEMRVPSGLQRTPGRLGGRPAVLVEPPITTPARPGTVLYFHGGANVVGSPETAMSLTGALVLRTGFSAWSVDYGLAPERPFPGGVEDCLAAYAELLDAGAAPGSIVFAGDSAGGGHAVTTCLAARDAGLPMPAAVVAFSPGLDATRTGESFSTRADRDPVLSPAGLAPLGQMYLNGADPDQELLSPATRADLAGFPPVLLQVGTNEILLDDSTRFATRAREAGVDVILDVVADVPHVFQSFTGVLDEADEALDRAALFVRQRLS